MKLNGIIAVVGLLSISCVYCAEKKTPLDHIKDRIQQPGQPAATHFLAPLPVEDLVARAHFKRTASPRPSSRVPKSPTSPGHVRLSSLTEEVLGAQGALEDSVRVVVPSEKQQSDDSQK